MITLALAALGISCFALGIALLSLLPRRGRHHRQLAGSHHKTKARHLP